MSVDSLAVAGFKEGSQYNENRPTYTDEAVTFISNQLTEVTVTPEEDIKYDVLELGAGTGLFTRKFLSVLPKTTRYLATEPSEGFLKTLQEESPDVETRRCAASFIPLPDNSVKMIVCAQCFHWFANKTAMDEMRRVIVEGGKLVLIWNRKDDSVPWLAEVIDYIDSLEDRLKYTREWYKDAMKGYAGFSEQHALILPGVEFKGDEDRMLHHLCSISVIAKRSGEEREAAIADIRRILQKHKESRNGDVITLPLTTDLYVYVCQKNK